MLEIPPPSLAVIILHPRNGGTAHWPNAKVPGVVGMLVSLDLSHKVRLATGCSGGAPLRPCTLAQYAKPDHTLHCLPRLGGFPGTPAGLPGPAWPSIKIPLREPTALPLGRLVCWHDQDKPCHLKPFPDGDTQQRRTY